MKATEKQINFLMKLNPELQREALVELEKFEASKMIGRLLKQSREEKGITTKVVKTQRFAEKKVESCFKISSLKQYHEINHSDDYDIKNIIGALKFDDGKYIAFTKPRIETRFCFGYGMYGISSLEDDKRASDLAENARTNEKYFIEKNLEGLNDKIKHLNECLNCELNVLALKPQWRNDNIVYYEFGKKMSSTDTRVYNSYNWYEMSGEYRLATKDEIRLLIKAYEEVKVMFTKRLNTYLKRYGLSKLHVWTYLVD